MSLSIKGKKIASAHFVGIMGSGMSALAQFLSWEGVQVSGSDRATHGEGTEDIKAKLEKSGCVIFPQDGTGISEKTDALFLSTAIEDDNPDLLAAQENFVPVYHRSDCLAALVEPRKTIAICGTSGKSTVTAMVFELLLACGKDPSLVSGANLTSLSEKGVLGNAWKGGSELLVVEADESDGTLTKYSANLSVFLNVSKDHNPVAQTIELFSKVAAVSAMVIKNADDSGLDTLASQKTFALDNDADIKPDKVMQLSPKVAFSLNGLDYSINLPGRHNLMNLLAAISVCEALGCERKAIADALPNYRGVMRRFSIARTKSGITVIDDFAHNPDKIRAVLTTAYDFGTRLFSIFQPHGFGPTRFLKEDLVSTFVEMLRPDDTLLLLPIFYAGGTAQQDIASEDLARPIMSKGKNAVVCDNRLELLSWLEENAKPTDAIILMGARDPSLSVLAEQIVNRLN